MSNTHGDILTTNPNLAEIGKLIGDPARAAILNALMSGVALPAGELARLAGVTPQTASSHLSKLIDGGLIKLFPSGRHRYFKIASAEVAQTLESLSLIGAPMARTRTLSAHLANTQICQARTCYDHLAGRLGVALTAQWVEMGWLLMGEYDFTVTDRAMKWLSAQHIDATGLLKGRRPAARQCLDWSERKPHVAGVLGAVLADWLLRERWLARVPSSRAVQVTDHGQAGFLREFGLDTRLVLTAISAVTR